ncbi:MAG: 23S rRNA (adenine(2503)-C(2))-methyltransferase RlmN [Desulfobacteraceae bacterium]|nr:MAG: 23S rRNA (adenine(2503)-C(2))-methyltransferase RlmN [Desulfobacteraceae bacterium]
MMDIKNYSRQAFLQWLEDHNERLFRADQMLKWLYVRLADRFDQMTDLSKSFRQLLADHFTIQRLPVAQVLSSIDGTRKFLFQLEDGQTIESVLIPERDHHTLCLSSQAGCAQGCRFCLTGQGGLIRNLTVGEIVGQVWEIRKLMDDPARLTNLVFMGMGEPLANYDHLVTALHILTNSDWGMKFASRRVTVSTAGLAPRIPDLGHDTRVNLAVSFNAVDDESRSRLMPINRKYAIDHLLDACRHYPLPGGRKITFEYILFKDVNDSPDHARKLAKLLAPLKAKINLIPFNPYPGSAFERPSQERIEAFQNVLIARHFTSVVRYSKGLDIMAACGQLRGTLNR